MKTEQKFKRGDVVRIAADLGLSMSHFRKDEDAVVMGSYADEYGGCNTKDYTLLFFGGQETSWYEEHQLTFLRHDGEDIITKIKDKRKEKDKIESDLNWIVANWKDIRANPSYATMKKLMRLIGITSPWGKHGEGMDLFNNQKYTFKCLDPVLLTGDIEKVKQFIKEFPKVNEFVFSSDLYNGNDELRRPEYIPD